MSTCDLLTADFLRRELPRGPVDVGTTPVLAAVGTLAETALANPLLHEPLAQAGLEPSRYLPFCTLEDLFASNVWQLALVISPFKQLVARHCSLLAPAATATEVVDTLIRADGELLGLNTNAYAAGEALRQLLTGAAIERLLVVGSGASARSVAFAMTTWYSTVRLGVWGRSTERARALAQAFAATAIESPADFAAEAVVHATTVGEQDDSVTLSSEVEAALSPGVRLFDLTNRLTALQVRGLANGCIVLSGILMQRMTNTLRVAAVSHAG
jgi:shikimate dehydrogenase